MKKKTKSNIIESAIEAIELRTETENHGSPTKEKKAYVKYIN